MAAVPNQIMLITYPDSLGGNLSALQTALSTWFIGAAGSLHILPFFPSNGDRGFSPITYDRVEAAFGNFADIEALSRQYFLLCDFMVNHISSQSAEFLDYVQNGDASAYAEMFIDYDAFFEGGSQPEELSRLYRRSDKPLYVPVRFADGTVKNLWCSFSNNQIDIDTNRAVTRRYLMDNLRNLHRHGLSMVRLDAYGYITKIRGTNCFFVEPDIWDLIQDLERMLGNMGMTLLPEVHDRYETALKIAQRGYYTYDFVLPLLMLHSIYSASGKEMKHWFAICPENQFTVLDTHDGIGVYDADGILSREQAAEVIQWIEPNLSYTFKPMDMSRRKHYKSYQLYCTYYSALNEDDEAYLMARAIQFFAPGIPQVYYVGMLAGANDLSFVLGEDHRFINRHNYTIEELAEEVRRPVVQRLMEMMRLRNTHPGFSGKLQIMDSPDHLIHLVREHEGKKVELLADLKQRSFELQFSDKSSMVIF